MPHPVGGGIGVTLRHCREKGTPTLNRSHHVLNESNYAHETRIALLGNNAFAHARIRKELLGYLTTSKPNARNMSLYGNHFTR